jgi:small-conductance mechanosensitive channel
MSGTAYNTKGDFSSDMSAYFWVDMAKTNPFAAKDVAFELVKAALDRNGIEIPFQIRTVYMQSES